MEHTEKSNNGRDLNRDIPQIGKDVGKDTRNELHSSIDKAAAQAQPTADRLASSAHTNVDRLAEKVQPTADRLAASAHTAVDKVADTATDVSATLAARGEQLSAAYGRFAETGRGYVRSSPAISVLVAVAAGYGLSKLFGTRK